METTSGFALQLIWILLALCVIGVLLLGALILLCVLLLAALIPPALVALVIFLIVRCVRKAKRKKMTTALDNPADL